MVRLYDELALDQAEWSQRTFGLDIEKGPLGSLRHLQEEVQEVLADPTDVTEYADCLLLVLDAARRAGFDHEVLVRAAHEKLQKNKKRVLEGSEGVANGTITRSPRSCC